MFAKIFLTVLLLSCVSTDMLKSTNNNNDTSFQKLPDNFNLKKNGTQTVNPNLKTINQQTFQEMITLVFGEGFLKIFEKYGIDFEHQKKLLTLDVLLKLQQVQVIEQVTNIFMMDVLPKLAHFKHDFNIQQ